MNIKIMRGIPGSGKSTLAKELAQQAHDMEFLPYIVSADNYFIKNGVYTFDPKQLGDAHRYCMQSFLNACNDKMNPIFVDNTNINIEDIAPYYAVGEALGYHVEIVQVNTPADMAAERNVHGVPRHKVREMDGRLQTIRLPRRWNITVVNP